MASPRAWLTRFSRCAVTVVNIVLGWSSNIFSELYALSLLPFHTGKVLL